MGLFKKAVYFTNSFFSSCSIQEGGIFKRVVLSCAYGIPYVCLHIVKYCHLFRTGDKIWLWDLISNIFLYIMQYSDFVSVSKAMRNSGSNLGQIFLNHQFFKCFNKKSSRMINIYLNIVCKGFFADFLHYFWKY